MRLSGVPLILLGVAWACAGCSDEQEPAQPTGTCQELSRTALTVEEADERGYAATEAIAAMQEGRTGDGQRLWITAPPEMWTAHGAEPPLELSTEGFLTVEVTGLQEIEREEAQETGWHFCESGLRISLDVTLTSVDGDASLVASATMDLARDRDIGSLKAALRIPGWDIADCKLAPSAAEQTPLSCVTVPLWADDDCLDASRFLAIDAGLQAPATALLEAANRMSPLDLVCGDGRVVSLSYELGAPPEYCPLPYVTQGGLAPALARLDSDGLSLPEAHGYASFLAGTCDGELSCGGLSVVAFVPSASNSLVLARFDFAADEEGNVKLYAKVDAPQAPGWNTEPRSDDLPCSGNVTLQ